MEKETNKQTDRQTDRQTHKQTERKDKQKHKFTQPAHQQNEEHYQLVRWNSHAIYCQGNSEVELIHQLGTVGCIKKN